MLFADPVSLEPDDVLNWFDLCSAGLSREEKEVYELLGRGQMYETVPDIFYVGASKDDVGEYFMSCRRELEIAAILILTASAEAKIRLDAALRVKLQDDLAGRLKLLRSKTVAGVARRSSLRLAERRRGLA